MRVIIWPVRIELPSRSLPDLCFIVFVWKLLKPRIPQVEQITVVKMCIILIKSETSIPYHKNTRTSIKSRKMQLLISSPKSLKNYLFFYFKWCFFTNRISWQIHFQFFQTCSFILQLRNLTDTFLAWKGKNFFLKPSTFSEVSKILLSDFFSGS